MVSKGSPDYREDHTDVMTDKLSSLNVDAPAFVPNINAAVFVPGMRYESSAQSAPSLPRNRVDSTSQESPPTEASSNSMQLKTGLPSECRLPTCLKSEKDLLKCSSCKVASYCGPPCQLQDWTNHKLECSTFQMEKLFVDIVHEKDKNLSATVKKMLEKADDPMSSEANAIRIHYFFSGPRLSRYYPPLPGPGLLNIIVANLMEYFMDNIAAEYFDLLDGSGAKEMMMVLTETLEWLTEGGSQVDWIRLCGDLLTASAAAIYVEVYLEERSVRGDIWGKWRCFLKAFRQFRDAIEVRAILVSCGEIDGLKSVIDRNLDMEPLHILLLDFPLVPVGNAPGEENPKSMIELVKKTKCILCQKILIAGTQILPWFCPNRTKEGTLSLARQVPNLPRRQSWTPQEELFRPSLPSKTLEKLYKDWIKQITRARTLPLGFVCSYNCENIITEGGAFEYPPLPDIPDKLKEEHQVPDEIDMSKFTVPKNPEKLLMQSCERGILVRAYHSIMRLDNLQESEEDKTRPNSSGYVPIELDMDEGIPTITLFGNNPKELSKKIKLPSNPSKFVVKLQIMSSPGERPILIYNEDKTVHGYINAEKNRKLNAYTKLKSVVAKDGVYGVLGPTQGKKAYLRARLGAKDKLEINPLKVLDSSMFEW